MNLLVFATLLIGIIGIYGQVLTVQAARIAAQQTGLASTMTIWHHAAMSMAASIVDTKQFPIGTPPCSLTFTLPVAGLATCPQPAGVIPPETGTVTDGAGVINSVISKSGNQEPVRLPASFSTNLYQFYSILYRDPATNKQPYVITFVQPPVVSAINPAPGFIQIPPPDPGTGRDRLTSFTLSDLLRQLKISGAQGYSYGTVSNVGGTSTLITAGSQYIESGAVFKIGFRFGNLPTIAGVPVLNDGAVALISSPLGF